MLLFFYYLIVDLVNCNSAWQDNSYWFSNYRTLHRTTLIIDNVEAFLSVLMRFDLMWFYLFSRYTKFDLTGSIWIDLTLNNFNFPHFQASISRFHFINQKLQSSIHMKNFTAPESEKKINLIHINLRSLKSHQFINTPNHIKNLSRSLKIIKRINNGMKFNICIISLLSHLSLLLF